MKKKGLGEFEELVLFVVCILDGKVYGVLVKEEIEKYIGCSILLGVVYIILYCFQDKGLLVFEFGGNMVKRGDRRKCFFIIIDVGSC